MITRTVINMKVDWTVEAYNAAVRNGAARRICCDVGISGNIERLCACGSKNFRYQIPYTRSAWHDGMLSTSHIISRTCGNGFRAFERYGAVAVNHPDVVYRMHTVFENIELAYSRSATADKIISSYPVIGRIQIVYLLVEFVCPVYQSVVSSLRFYIILSFFIIQPICPICHI